MVRFGRIIWVDATSAETIQLSLRDLAVSDPEAKSWKVEDSTGSVLRWPSRIDDEWFIVFDNANANISHRETGATSCLLAVWRHVPDEARVKIEDIDEDAVSLLLNSAFFDEPRTELREAARSIAGELLFLPLAVHQAGASIASGLFHIDDYLRTYSQHHQKLLADPTFKGAPNCIFGYFVDRDGLQEVWLYYCHFIRRHTVYFSSSDHFGFSICIS